MLTDNRKQWGDALLQLDQLVVESLDKRQVQELATAHNCLDKQLGSVKQLQKVFDELGYSRDEIEVFGELHFLRSKIVGHKAGSEAEHIVKQLRKKHRSFPAHFDDLLSRMSEAMQFLLDHKGELTADP